MLVDVTASSLKGLEKSHQSDKFVGYALGRPKSYRHFGSTTKQLIFN